MELIRTMPVGLHHRFDKVIQASMRLKLNDDECPE